MVTQVEFKITKKGQLICKICELRILKSLRARGPLLFFLLFYKAVITDKCFTVKIRRN